MVGFCGRLYRGSSGVVEGSGFVWIQFNGACSRCERMYQWVSNEMSGGRTLFEAFVVKDDGFVLLKRRRCGDPR
jgi:hypothetical protein